MKGTGRAVDMTGLRSGKLVALQRVGTDKYRHALWMCICDCGNEKVVDQNSLQKGAVKSCGCLIKEVTAVTNRIPKHKTHGHSKTRLYKIYIGMKNRCLNEASKDYPNYGGRGISVCDQWRNDPVSFINWALSHGYNNNLSLDRINNDGNYEPDNCRWATDCQQQNNKSTSRKVNINGVSKTVTEWARTMDISLDTIRSRMKSGWNDVDAIMKPLIRGGMKNA